MTEGRSAASLICELPNELNDPAIFVSAQGERERERVVEIIFHGIFSYASERLDLAFRSAGNCIQPERYDVWKQVRLKAQFRRTAGRCRERGGGKNESAGSPNATIRLPASRMIPFFHGGSLKTEAEDGSS